MKSIIITPEAAFKYLGIPFSQPDLSGIVDKHQKAILALYLLFIIIEARNKEANGGKPWAPKYDGSEWHYFPYFYLGEDNGSGFSFFDYDYYSRRSTVGSRLEFISSEVCEDTANTFLDLYRDAHTLMPQAVAEPEASKAE